MPLILNNSPKIRFLCLMQRHAASTYAMPRCRSLSCKGDQLSGSSVAFPYIPSYLNIQWFPCELQITYKPALHFPWSTHHLQAWDMQVSSLVRVSCQLQIAWLNSSSRFPNHLQLRNRQPQLQVDSLFSSKFDRLRGRSSQAEGFGGDTLRIMYHLLHLMIRPQPLTQL